MMITAKVACNLKQEYGTAEDRQATVGFMADYTDDRNKEWSRFTPHLKLLMTLRGDVADQFDLGQSYTITFEPEPSA